MTGRLPQGLIVIAEHDPEEASPDSQDEEDDRVPAEVLARTWKVYTTTSNAVREDSAERLENLYWRVWGNPYLVRKIRASTVTQLMFRIGRGLDDFDLSRRQRNPSTLNGSRLSEDNVSPQIPPGVEPSTTLTHPINKSSSESPGSRSRSPSSSPRSPQSILKRPKVEFEASSKSANGSVPRRGDIIGRNQRGNSASGTDDPTSVLPNDPEVRGANGNKKRLSFVASTAARAKTRPSLSRRKSSQQSAGSQSAEPSRSPVKQPGGILRDSSTRTGSRVSEAQPSSDLLRPAEKISGLALSSTSSWQSDDSDSSLQGGLKPAAETSQSNPVLVNRGFREKFVEDQKRTLSFSNLAMTNRLKKTGSVVRFADEIPGQLKKGKEREVPPASESEGDDSSDVGSVTLRERAQRKSSGDSEALIDDEEEGDEGESGGLARTKSQLSLMIQSQRRSSGTRFLGPTHAAEEGKEKAPKKKEASEKRDDENELLMMGRSDGVTKAGGVVPGRSTQRISGSSQHRYRSPTPPPLYG